MAQTLYPNIVAILKWVFDIDVPLVTEAATFSSFSQCWVSLMLFGIMSMVCIRRDLSFFIKIISIGCIFIIMIAIFIVSVGFYSIGNTDFSIVTLPDPSEKIFLEAELSTNFRKIFLINTNFTPLAGVLGIGYFLHPVSIPIVR